MKVSRMKESNAIVIILFLVTIIVFISAEKIPTLENVLNSNTLSLTSVGGIASNPEKFENKTVRLKGTFYEIIGYGIYDEDTAVNLFDYETYIDYKLIDSQGFEIFISAPKRELNIYNGKVITIQGVIKSGSKCYSIATKDCKQTHYLELLNIL